MGYAVKMGKINDGRPQLSYFTFLEGNNTKRPTSENVPAVTTGPKFVDGDGKTKQNKIPCSGFFILPFNYCVGGYLVSYSTNPQSNAFVFSTKPASLDAYYIDPRGKKWFNAFQTRLTCGERTVQNSVTPQEVDYKWHNVGLGSSGNSGQFYQTYIEYVNYFSLCNVYTRPWSFNDGYLFGFRDREYLHIDYDESGNGPDDWIYPDFAIPRMKLRIGSSTSSAYFLALSIPCIIDTNICDTMSVRLTDNRHGTSGLANMYRYVSRQGDVNYTLIPRDNKKYEDLNGSSGGYTEYTDFVVPSGVKSYTKYPNTNRFMPDATHYGNEYYKWAPEGVNNNIQDYCTTHSNYTSLQDHVARSELNLSLIVTDSNGTILRPSVGETIRLNFDFVVYRKNLMGNNQSGRRIGATIRVDKEFVVE